MTITDVHNARKDTIIVSLGVICFLAGAFLITVFWPIAVPLIAGGAAAAVCGFCYKFFGE